MTLITSIELIGRLWCIKHVLNLNINDNSVLIFDIIVTLRVRKLVILKRSLF